MRPEVWRPPVEPSPTERAVIKAVRRAKLCQRARYRGTRKNLFDLRRIAAVHNLHVMARQPTATGYQLAT